MLLMHSVTLTVTVQSTSPSLKIINVKNVTPKPDQIKPNQTKKISS